MFFGHSLRKISGWRKNSLCQFGVNFPRRLSHNSDPGRTSQETNAPLTSDLKAKRVYCLHRAPPFLPAARNNEKTLRGNAGFGVISMVPDGLNDSFSDIFQNGRMNGFYCRNDVIASLCFIKSNKILRIFVGTDAVRQAQCILMFLSVIRRQAFSRYRRSA